MSKRFRLFLTLLVIVIGGVFLFPTFRWYFLVPEHQKELASGTREQIRQWAQEKARDSLAEFKALGPDEQVPGKFDFLISEAKKNYSIARTAKPDVWTARAVRDSFPGNSLAELEGSLYTTIEEYYRAEIQQLKERKINIMQLGLDLSGGMSVVLEADMESLAKRLDKEPSSEEREDAIQRALTVLTNRIDRFGVTEPEIRRQGEEQIYIEIPGDTDPERVRSFIMGKGSLNFHLVDEDATGLLIEYQQDNPSYIPSEDGRLGFIPAGSVVRGYYTKDPYGLDQLIRYIVVEETPGLDGAHIQSATTARDPVTNQPVVNFSLDREGSDIFYKMTEANVGKSLAIVMDDKVKAYARIQEAIPSGQVRISGFSAEEANAIALVLRTAALPVDLIIQNQQAVGPSLGRDTIDAGLRAIALGFGLVIIFMLAYYKGAGVNATVALVLNLFLTMAVLSAFNLTLTLTSIAGLILTVGMAVDANVIIFERIKEEHHLGKSRQASINAGFRKAFWAIMDSNITTFIAAIFLSQLGSGPVQGFAYTLAVGIVCSMFTALFVSRLIFDFSTEVLNTQKLSISWRAS